MHLLTPVHVFAPQFVDVFPPDLLLLLAELLCLLSLTIITHHKWQVFDKNLRISQREIKLALKIVWQDLISHVLLQFLQFAPPLLLLCLSDSSHLKCKSKVFSLFNFESNSSPKM